MVVRNSLIYITARLIPGLLGVLTTSILTRLLPPSAYGLYGLTQIIMSFGSTIAFEWLGLSFMRFYESRRHDARTIPTFIALYGVMMVVTAVVMGAVWLVGWIPPADAPLFGIGLCMAYAFAFFELVARFEVAAFRPMRYLALNLNRAWLLAAFTLGAAALTHDPLYTAAATCAALCLALIPTGRRHLIVRRGQFDRALAWQAMTFGAPFAVSMLLLSMFTSGVRGLVGILTSAHELGLYAAAYALSQNVLTVVVSALGSATYPSAVRAWEQGDGVALRRQLEQNFAVVLGALAPASLGMALTAHDLAQLLVAPEYRATVVLLTPWMALTSLLGGFRGVYLDQAFQLGKKPNQQVVVTTVATVIAVAGTLALVPLLGLVGAPIATSIAVGLSCVHAAWLGRSAQPMPLPLAVIAKVGLAAAAMTVVVLMVPAGLPLSLGERMLAGAATYSAVCVALNLLGLRKSVLTLFAACRRFLGRLRGRRAAGNAL